MKRTRQMTMAQLKKFGFTERERASVEHSVDPNYEPDRRARPTSARPGSIEKLETMCRRLRKRQPLFVDGDKVDQHAMVEPAKWAQGYNGSFRKMLDPNRNHSY